MMNKLQEIRAKKGYTQEFMAKMLCIGVSTYNQYENNVRGVPLKVAKKAANVLDVQINDIFLPTKFTVSKIKKK